MSSNQSFNFQQSGAYHYDPNRVYANEAHADSSQSLTFQPPQPTHGASRSRQTSNYNHHPDDYYYEQTAPSQIFTAPEAPNLQPLSYDRIPSLSHDNPFTDDPAHHNYEMNTLRDYNYNTDPQGPHQLYEQAFVANAYDDDDYDEDERAFDERINYQDFGGENYHIMTYRQPEEHYQELYDPSLRQTGEMLVNIADESPFGEEGEEFDKPPDEGEQPVRKREVQVDGYNGHLILDCPVAKELLKKFHDYDPSKPDEGLVREFTHMRYTAVTCGPSNFRRQGYVLRPRHYPTPRETEMMVVITMYNEDDILLARTLKGVFKNIKHLQSRTRSSVWGKDSWKKIVVCIVSDGRSKINERAQALLAGLGVYQEGLAKSVVNDLPVKAHIYEYTSNVGISSIEDTVKLTTEKVVPVQLMFLLKEKNEKKINSHRWCFQAVSDILDPKIVVLLDAGTQPSGKSLYHLWKEFDRDPRVAGACGEIKAKLQPYQFFTNPLVYGQNFEYKISNILDKPTESVFGFISVLPGAFSAYRSAALKNDINGKGPLEKYFKGEFLHSSGILDQNDDEYALKNSMLKEEAGIFTSNMYLAEDRILCFELVAKRGCSWVLRYCKSASAETDVPERLAEFILQRRRWLNGSFFAAIYALAHFGKLWSSSHSIAKKFWLHVEFFYQFLNLIVSWFSIGSYFLVFRILTTSLADPALNFAPGNVLSVIFLWLYLASIVTTFVLSFGNKPKGTEKFYIVIVCFFAILMAYMIFAAIFMAVKSIEALYNEGPITVQTFFKNAEFRDLVVATSSTYALYFMASFIYFEPWHMFTSFTQYILLSPAYINVLNIYAFCNIDDISWGTKGDTGAKDLGHAKVKEDGSFDVQIPVFAEEINQSYLNQLDKIKKPAPKEEGPSQPSNDDYYAFVRSMTVLVWMVSNFVIIALVLETAGVDQLSGSITSDSTSRSQIFLTVILWTVAFMAAFRFIGCVFYLIQRGFRKLKGRREKRPVSVPLVAVPKY